MLTLLFFHPVTGDYIYHLEQFISVEMRQRLNGCGRMDFCVKCEFLRVADNQFNWKELCYRVEMYCKDEKGKRKLFDGYTRRITEEEDRICVRCIDEATRLKYRLLRGGITFVPNPITGVTIPVELMIAQLYTAIDVNYTLSPIVLGNIHAPEGLVNTQSYPIGTSLKHILSDLAKKTGAQWRVCNNMIDFVVPDDTVGGVGEVKPGHYQWVYESQTNNITDWSYTSSLENFCNLKISRDQNNPKDYCFVPDDQTGPSDTIQDCGVRECFESNPEGHDFNGEDQFDEYPNIKVEDSCDDWCDIKVGDRKQVKIVNCIGEVRRFEAIFTSKRVRCTSEGIKAEYDLSSSENSRLTVSEYIDSLEERINKLERN